jgi:hypothetical protein
VVCVVSESVTDALSLSMRSEARVFHFGQVMMPIINGSYRESEIGASACDSGLGLVGPDRRLTVCCAAT